MIQEKKANPGLISGTTLIDLVQPKIGQRRMNKRYVKVEEEERRVKNNLPLPQEVEHHSGRPNML